MIRQFANPGRFLALTRWLIPLSGVVALVSGLAGLYMALLASPPDYQQGDSVRIMYLHVPAAWMAMSIYTSMAVAAVVGIVWKHIVAELYVRAAALPGAAFTLICLVTGSLWGKPMWGAWWVWDARLTSVLILFFLYLGYMVLVTSFDDEEKSLRAGAWLLIAGAVNIPIIKFSVDWWNTLHQPSSVFRMQGPAIDGSMLAPLLLMAVSFQFLFIWLACVRLKTAIGRRRRAVKERIS